MFGSWRTQTVDERQVISSESTISETVKSYINVILVGLPGSGKSTVGKHLSVILGLGFVDLDALIEAKHGKSVEAIWKDDGEEQFRQVEKAELQRLASIKSHVIALGGGALQDEDSLGLVKKLGPLVWLRPSPDEVARRLYMRPSELEKRPMFADLLSVENKDDRRIKIRERVASLSDRRSVMYQHADIVLDGGYVTPETSACQLKDILTSLGYQHKKLGDHDIWRGRS